MDNDRTLPPGTVYLIDHNNELGGTTKHATGSADERDIILHPTPSDDPEDPLYVRETLDKAISCQC